MKPLGFGLMRLPQKDNPTWNNVDMDESRRLIDRFLEKGFTYFDTAYVYQGGLNESLFGELVASRYERERFTVTTKMPVFAIKTAEDYPRIFAEQLERCKVSYFDYYLLHALNRNTYQKAMETGAFDFIARMKAEGKIRCIGFSYHDDAETLEKILSEHPEIELVQLQLNYLDWEDEKVQGRLCHEVCVRHGVKVAVMEPLKGGALIRIPEKAAERLQEAVFSRSIPDWGLRFAANLENVIVVLSGMSTFEQVEENTDVFDTMSPLTDGELAALRETADIIRESIAVPCTACSYCTDSCPSKINIPALFTLYNNHHRFGMLPSYRDRFADIAKKGGKPSDCIECRACEEHCPQKIAVADELKKVKEAFEG